MDSYTIKETIIPELGTPTKGKVRDIYQQDGCLVLIATDRISVFDVTLPQTIPGKGSMLTQLSVFWFNHTADIVENHMIAHPDPNILVVKKCRPLQVEIIVRKYLVGSLWRDYEKGKRTKSGVTLPEGLKRNDPLPKPILTPSTKSHEGHDIDITKQELIEQGIVTTEQWGQLEQIAMKLFERGTLIAKNRGLVLVDTKYEFGVDETEKLLLIDEIHTPDSSRFWLEEDVAKKQLKFPDKEFAREWSMTKGFMGEGNIPDIPDEIREQIHQGYRNIYERITGEQYQPATEPVQTRMRQHLEQAHILILSGV